MFKQRGGCLNICDGEEEVFKQSGGCLNICGGEGGGV